MALFRLWFQLIKAYVTFLIFVIMGPIWIVFGLIPGRPLGFEKWLRIIFANLAVFPLVAFILVFARVLMDALPGVTNPQAVFMPPLVGNPNISTFSVFLGFGAIMIAPTIPDQIKDRMKATGQGKMGAAVASGLSMAAGATTAPARKVWENVNRRNPTTGAPEGALAVRRAQMVRNLPVIGRRVRAGDQKREDVRQAHYDGDWSRVAQGRDYRRWAGEDQQTQRGQRQAYKQQVRDMNSDTGFWGRQARKVTGRTRRPAPPRPERNGRRRGDDPEREGLD